MTGVNLGYILPCMSEEVTRMSKQDKRSPKVDQATVRAAEQLRATIAANLAALRSKAA